jgi:hypothetical protein
MTWMMCTVEDEFSPTPVVKRGWEKFRSTDSSFTVKQFKGGGPHISNARSAYKRNFTRQEADNLINGYPPFHRERILCNTASNQVWIDPPILHPILKAAYDGVETCIGYMKTPGREMQVLLPSNVDDVECFYVPI